MNILDLGKSSKEQVTLVKIILKLDNPSHAELWDAIQQLPENNRMSRELFDDAMQALINMKWLRKTGEGDQAHYRPRMQKRISHVRVRVPIGANQTGSFSPFSLMWGLLEQRAVLEQEAALTPAAPTQPAIASRVTGWFSGLAGGQRAGILLIFISAVSAFSASTLDITGTAGFVNLLGTPNLPWLWVVEMLLGLATSAVYMQFADRIPRVRLMRWMLGGLASIYLIMAGLFLLVTNPSISLFGQLAKNFQLAGPQAFLYPLIYLLRSQQIIILPIAFWTLANNLYSMAEARKVFPILASGGTIGGLIGYTLFTEFVKGKAIFTSDQAPILLTLNVVLFLIIFLLIKNAIQETDDDDEEEASQNFFSHLKAGMETIHEIPLFRYLSISILLERIVFCFLIYHNIYSLSHSGGNFSNLLSIFSIAGAVLPLFLQWRVTPVFSEKVETKNAFLVLPITLALAIGTTILVPGVLAIAVVLVASGSVASSWDYPMMNTLQNLIPEERRAQISTLLNNYSFAIGQIIGSVLLLIILTLTTQHNFEPDLAYLPIGLAAALGAILAAFMVQQTYTESMLSWRVARRQRSSSVLDKLDF